MALALIMVIFVGQIDAEEGFEENFFPLTGSILAPDPPTFYNLNVNLGINYAYYSYYPYDDEIPHYPDVKLCGSYRFIQGKTINPLMRNCLSLSLMGRVGIYPKQSETDRHLPYFAGGMAVGFIDESLLLPKISVKVLATRIKNFNILPSDPYYAIEVKRSDILTIGMEVKKLVSSFDLSITPMYHYANVNGSYRSYTGTEEPEVLDGSDISNEDYNASFSRYGFIANLGIRRLSLSLGYLSAWQLGLYYRLVG